MVKTMLQRRWKSKNDGAVPGVPNRYNLPCDETPCRLDIEARDFLDIAAPGNTMILPGPTRRMTMTGACGVVGAA